MPSTTGQAPPAGMGWYGMGMPPQYNPAMFGQPQVAGQQGWGGTYRPTGEEEQRASEGKREEEYEEASAKNSENNPSDDEEAQEDSDDEDDVRATTKRRKSNPTPPGKKDRNEDGSGTPRQPGGAWYGGPLGGGTPTTIMTLIEREAGKYKTARFEKELDFNLSEEDADEFRTNLIESTDPFCVLYMKMGSPKPNLLHSVTKCSATDTEYYGEFIGFTVANRGDNPIVLPKLKAWKWLAAKIPHEEIMTDVEDENLWGEIQNTIMYETQSVPYLMVCPRALIKDLVLSGKNVLEGYTWLEKTFPEREDMAALKTWFAAACYREQLKLSMKQVETTDSRFYEWVTQVLAERKIGGTVSTQQAQYQQHQGAGPIDPQTMMFMSMMQQQQASHQQWMFQMQCQQQQLVLQAQQGGAPAQASVKKLDPSFEAMMCGYACVTSVADLPSFLDDTEGLDSEGLERYIKGVFTSKLNKWATKMNYSLDISWDLQSDNVSDWRKGKFNIGTKGMYEAGSQGMSPFNAVPLTEAQINKRRESKRARMQSAHTRTFQEAIQHEKEKWEPLDPPTTLSDLTAVLMVYQGMLMVVHGEKCDLYIKVGELVEVLKLKRVLKLKEKFNGIVALKIFWAVVVESRRFFEEVMTPDQLVDAHPPFYRTGLSRILNDVENVREVEFPCFPTQWLQLGRSTGGNLTSNSIIQTPLLQSGRQRQAQGVTFSPWVPQQMYPFSPFQSGFPGFQPSSTPPAPAPVPSLQKGEQMSMVPESILFQLN